MEQLPTPLHLGQLHQIVFNLLMREGSLRIQDLKKAIRAAQKVGTEEAVMFVQGNLYGHTDEEGKEFLKRVCRLRLRS